MKLYLLDAKAVSASFGERHEMLLEILTSLGRFDPSLRAEGVGVRKDCCVLVDEIGGTAHWGLRHNVSIPR